MGVGVVVVGGVCDGVAASLPACSPSPLCSFASSRRTHLSALTILHPTCLATVLICMYLHSSCLL